MSMESVFVKNPNLGSFFSSSPFRRITASPAVSPSSSLRFEPLLPPRTCRFSVARGNASPGGFHFRLLPLGSRNSSVIPSAASHEDSKLPDIDLEKEKKDLEAKTEDSEEAWKQTLAAFKEQALKMQSVSQEAYDIYSKKAMVILKETSEQLKIQSEKARYDLSVVAKELSEEGREYLSAAAENSPEPVREIMETFSSPTEDLNDISKIQDFYLGIPYGLLLSFGGFLCFMITGSIPAIRFGVILGGALLAFSISSLRSFRKGRSPSLALKGQTGIAGIIFLREIHFLSQRLSLFNFITAFISGSMLAFYLYRIKQNRDKRKGMAHEDGIET